MMKGAVPMMAVLMHMFSGTPSMKEETFFHSRVIRDLTEFKELSDVILANRYHEDIADVIDKVYTRDLYFRD